MVTKFLDINGSAIVPSEGYRRQATIYGLSKDTKPTENVKNADIFYEMDTKKVFLFNQESKTWLAQ